jgi:hypothetical protein
MKNKYPLTFYKKKEMKPKAFLFTDIIMIAASLIIIFTMIFDISERDIYEQH